MVVPVAVVIGWTAYIGEPSAPGASTTWFVNGNRLALTEGPAPDDHWDGRFGAPGVDNTVAEVWRRRRTRAP